MKARSRESSLARANPAQGGGKQLAAHRSCSAFHSQDTRYLTPTIDPRNAFYSNAPQGAWASLKPRDLFRLATDAGGFGGLVRPRIVLRPIFHPAPFMSAK